jgi:hypothetical protein
MPAVVAMIVGKLRESELPRFMAEVDPPVLRAMRKLFDSAPQRGQRGRFSPDSSELLTSEERSALNAYLEPRLALLAMEWAAVRMNQVVEAREERLYVSA